MTHGFVPRDLIVWLSLYDVNRLTDEEGRIVARYDIETESGLDQLVTHWLKPKYLEHDEANRAEMRVVLDRSRDWSSKELQPVFEEVQLPSGQQVRDISRFMSALRAVILT